MFGVIFTAVSTVAGSVLVGYGCHWLGETIGVSAPWWAWSLIMSATGSHLMSNLRDKAAGAVVTKLEADLETIKLEIAALRSRLVPEEDGEDSIP